MRNIDLTKCPESQCPKFLTCGICKCPLSRNYEKLQNDSSDPATKNKEKCTSRNIRKEIGKAFGLKYGGMTTREFNGAKRWADMTPEAREKAVGKLQQISPIARLSAKGYTICPKKRDNSQTHRQNAKYGSEMPSMDGYAEGLE